MRFVTLAGLLCAVGVLNGCGGYATGGGGHSVEFVSSSPDSVLLDFGARPAGEFAMANAKASDQCHLFNRGDAVLESLNVRTEGVIRGTYRCVK